MTRRVLAALLGLTVALLAGVVVPLGLVSAGHDRQVFAERALATAAAVADRVEEGVATTSGGSTAGELVTGPGLSSLPAGLDLHGRPDDQVAVYDTGGRLLGATSDAQLPASRRAPYRPRTATHRWLDDPSELAITSPVVLGDDPAGSGGQPVGFVVLVRPSGPLGSELTRLWGSLAGAGVLALAAAAALGVLLARWVNRPLQRLDAAAAGLGGEAPGSRAQTGAGPREVRQLAVTFNRMAARLEALVDAQRHVIADVSHQLRTPLAALRLRLDLLRQDAEGDSAVELDAALGEVARLSRLLDGLLAVARAENTGPAAQLVDVPAVAVERIEAWVPVAAEAGLSVTLDAGGSVPAARATPGTLEQVLDNLLANAIDATPAPGRISVTVRGADGVVRVTVSDTGPGMSARDRELALQRFWSDHPGASGPAARSDGRGSGLGLAIVQRLVTVDGGRLALAEADGGGLAAVVDLPAAPAPAGATEAGR